MIYKGLMGREEVELLNEKYNEISIYYIRTDSMVEIGSLEELAQIDIDVEVYNDIMKSPKVKGQLTLTANSRGNMVTGYMVFEMQSYINIIKSFMGDNQSLNRMNKEGRLIIINDSKGNMSKLESFKYFAGDLNTTSARMGYNRFKPSIHNSRDENTARFSSMLEMVIIEIDGLENSKEERAVMVIYIPRNESLRRPTVGYVYDTGTTIGKMGDYYNIDNSEYEVSYNRDLQGDSGVLSEVKTSSYAFKMPFSVDLDKNDYLKYISPEASALFFKKIRKFITKRLNTGVHSREATAFIETGIKAFTIDSRNIDSSLGVKPNTRNKLYTTHYDSLTQLRNPHIFTVSNESFDALLQEKLYFALETFQQNTGKYKPLPREFFSGRSFSGKNTEDNKGKKINSEKYKELRDIFWPPLYANINRALGGHVTGSGKRTYKPNVNIGGNPISKYMDLNQDDKDIIEIYNKSPNEPYVMEDTETHIEKYNTFLSNFMEGYSKASTSDGNSLHKISEERKTNYFEFLSDMGLAVGSDMTNDLYLFRIKRVDGRRLEPFPYLLNSSPARAIKKYMEGYFITVNLKQKDIIVIKPSLVTDSSRFSVNFQDFDIRVDLINIMNRIKTGATKESTGVHGTVEGKGGMNPSDVADRNYSNIIEGVTNDERLIVYEPFKWDAVTKRRSGHILFENTDGVLVFFPFDSFFHDVEGHGDTKGDLCFTPCSGIWSVDFIIDLKKAWETREELRDLVYEELKRNPIHAYQRAACVRFGTVPFQPMGDSAYLLGGTAEKYGDKFPFDWNAFGRGTVESINPENETYGRRDESLIIIYRRLFGDYSGPLSAARDEAGKLVRDIMKNYYKENPELVQPERLAQRNMTRGD